MRSALLLPLAALAVGLTISCSSQRPEINAFVDPVKIDTGYVSGTVIGDVGKEVRIYRGIPYAAPPVGDLRWKPPQPVKPWTGIRECTVYGNTPPQISDLAIRVATMPLSEDCLYLNVLTPARKSSEELPVMVWMHGGGYTRGDGSFPITNLPRLPQNGIVLVTVNMRIGPLGLLSHPLLSRESPNKISGNYMFFDMIAALRWVQRNIAAFGGDSENVTIFGESGGGMKVGYLLASPLAKNLFHRAIMESGAPAGPFAGKPMKDLEAMGEKYFEILEVDKNPDPLKAARALTWEKILEAENRLPKELSGYGGLWTPCIDGYFLTDVPLNIFKAGRQNPVPVITTANLGELTGPGTNILPTKLLSIDYATILNAANTGGQKGYACIFDHVPSKWKEEGCVSFHALELGYVFGDWDNTSGFWNNFFNDAKEAGAKTLNPGLTEIDKKVSENMMAMWAQFARTGDPNVEGLINWPAYDSGTDQYLYITEPLQVNSGFSEVGQKK